jgi:hypothetical protein
VSESVAPGTLPCLCNTSAGPAGCPLHAPGRAVVAAALAHRHRWVYDGQQPDGRLVYHCDDHDPPLARIVAALAEEPKL